MPDLKFLIWQSGSIVWPPKQSKILHDIKDLEPLFKKQINDISLKSVQECNYLLNKLELMILMVLNDTDLVGMEGTLICI